jgi:hypothetical protein
MLPAGSDKEGTWHSRRDRREEFHQTWVDFFEPYREGDQVVHHREYLLTLGTRR